MWGILEMDNGGKREGMLNSKNNVLIDNLGYEWRLCFLIFIVGDCWFCLEICY